MKNFFAPGESKNIFPYIISNACSKDGSVYIETLGHGLYTSLVYYVNGLVKSVKPAEVENSGMLMQEIMKPAIANLENAARSQQIAVTFLDAPGNIPFVLFSDSWLSASCILLPGIDAKFKAHLGTEGIFVCMPHRHAMFVFPVLTPAQRIKMKRFVTENEFGSREPLSFEFFKIQNSKISADLQ
jgi:hypothetical protein